MIELPLIFVAGFLGSAHCIGMCGPFALLLGGSSHSWRRGLFRQGLYSVGRIFTYVTIGAVSGFCGIHFSHVAAEWINVPACLSIAAGLFLTGQGLATLGIVRLPGRFSSEGAGVCLAGGLLTQFLRNPRDVDVFIAGILTGMLPCGLVYGFAGIAASQQDVLTGVLVMASFGLGTVPIMVVTGIGGRVASMSARVRVLRAAAWCLTLAGILSIVRGVSFLGQVDVTSGDCPLCY